LDNKVQQQYEAEISMSYIIDAFTIMAIMISSLGLFGLAAFSAEQRSKEISIRKVLGASVPGITRLLSKDFLRLVLVAFVIAVPISWWLMNKWLEGFAYRTSISWWMYAVAGLVSVFIAMITVSSQALRAALSNPAKSLRSQ
jgi:putative ABC transport system permease protein